MSKKKRTPFVIVRDTREQSGYDFGEFEGLAIVRDEALNVGDYAAESADGTRPPVAIERKSQADLLASITAGRDRFEREFRRAIAAGKIVHLVCECSWDDLGRPLPSGFARGVSPAAVRGTLASWSMRLGVRVWLAGDRVSAERLTFHLLRFAIEQHAAGDLPTSQSGIDAAALAAELRALADRIVTPPIPNPSDTATI